MPNLSKVQEEPGSSGSAVVTSLNGVTGAIVLPEVYEYLINYNPKTALYQAVSQAGAVAKTGASTDIVIQYALTQLIANGGTIFFKNNNANGDYSFAINADLSGLNNINLFCEKGTRCFLAASNPKTVAGRTIFYGSGVTNCRIEGFILDGNYANLSSWVGVSAYGNIYFQGNCSHINIIDNDIINARMYGVAISAFTNQTIYDVNTQGNRFIQGGFWNSIYYLSYDSHVGYGVKDCDISNNDLSGFCDIGIAVGQAISGTTFMVTVHNNRLHDGNTSGMGSGGGTDQIFAMRVEGVVNNCSCHHNEMYQIRIGFGDDSNASYNSFHHNFVQNNLAGAIDGSQIYGTYETVDHNRFFSGYTDFFSGINVQGSDCTCEWNAVYNIGGTPNLGGISENAVVNNGVYRYNDVRQCNYPINISTGTGTIIEGNPGYNPKGYITNPLPASGNYLVDSGTNASFVSTTTYTCSQSPKTVYIEGGTVSAVIHNGRTLATVTSATSSITLNLRPGDTFSVTFSIAPTINVMGQ